MSDRQVILFNPTHYDYLPFALQPPQDGSPGFRGGPTELIKLMPLMHLPRGLIPKRGLFVQPPRFHYGWGCTPQDLFDMAVHGNFLCSDPVKPGEVLGIKHMDDLATVAKLAQIMRDELGITSCTPVLWIAWSRRSPVCISLTNNYIRGNRTPPEEDIAAIQKLLGIEEPPSWLLDSEGCGKWDVRKF